MKKIISLLILACIILVNVSMQSCQSAKNSSATPLLKFNFEKGGGFDYEMIINMDQELMGEKMEMDMTTYYSLLVVDDDGIIKTVKSTFDRFKMRMAVKGFNIEIDTEKPLPDFGLNENETKPMLLLNNMLGAIKGKEFFMRVDAEGKVLEVNGFENMAK